MVITILLLILSISSEVNSLVLKQVLILSRHNVRAPLTRNLERITQLHWPKWQTETAHLTPKGAKMEGYIAEYIVNWLKQEKLLQESCPEEDSVYIYANAPQRTRQTAKAFTDSAFESCNLSVYYRNDVIMDPVFHPILRNTSNSFKETVMADMQRKLDKVDLKDAYTLLNEVLEFENSDLCKIDSFCDLVSEKDRIIFEIGEEPNVYGPLSIGNSVVDVFLMSLYEGFRPENIAWGKISKPDQWKLLAKITKQNQNIRFNSTILAKDVAKPLLKYISNVFLNESAPKLTVLFGHDSNLNSIITSLGFKYFELPNQYERTPLGGKLVFQKWHDENNRDLLKVEYIYQSVQQLIKGTRLTNDNKPQIVTMELINCSVDKEGYCLWEDFRNILINLNE